MHKNNYTLSLLFFLFISPLFVSAQFTEISIESGIIFQHTSVFYIGGGASFLDYDNDGWLDIYLAGGETDDALYHNNQDGTFTDVSEAAGLASVASFQTTGTVAADVDNDGFTDIFILTWDTQPSLLLHNNGDGTFTERAEEMGLSNPSFSMAASFGDYNLDGFLDLYVGNYIKENGGYSPEEGFGHVGYSNFFYINKGDGTFEEVSESYGLNDAGCTLSVAFTNLDNDGDVDLLIANDFGEWVEPSAAFENLYPSDVFSNISPQAALDAEIYAMGIAVGDYNEDGFLDHYVTNIGHNHLFENKGNLTFEERAIAAGVDNTYTNQVNPETGKTLFATSWGTAFFDYDHDTYLDLFVSNGHIPSADIIENAFADPNKLYRNNQADGTFTDVSEAMGVAQTDVCRGMAIGDYDNDGDMDILVVAITDPSVPATFEDHVLLYRNDSPSANWLKVELEGVTNNRQGIGSRIEISVDGRTFIREIDGGSSHASNNSKIAHFGLGDYEMIDELKVYWLGGEEQVLTNVSVNQTLHIIEGRDVAIEEHAANLLQLNSLPNPIEENTQIHYYLPESSKVSLEVYNTKGQLVDQILKNQQTSGKHIVEWSPSSTLSPGVYFCRIYTDFGVASHRLVVGW